MDKIKYFFECLIPITVCNMKCHYCYVAQRHHRTMKMPSMPYSPKHIAQALRKERLGGLAYISICGAGETTMVKELPELCFELTKEGHYLNITTNGTYGRFFEKLFALCSPELLSHINFSFSLHYLELVRLDAFDKFFGNINKVKERGCSFMVQFNLCDEYEPYLEDIKRRCLENVGAYPQIAATRDEINLSKDIRLYTKHTKEEYVASVKDFKSPLFDFTMKNFMVKRNEYCYAGKWGGQLEFIYWSFQTMLCKSNISEYLRRIVETYQVDICWASLYFSILHEFLSFYKFGYDSKLSSANLWRIT